MTKSSKSALALHYAHALQKARPNFAWKNNLIHAWQRVRFHEMLRTQVLRFTYIKKNGMARIAYGTLRPDLIPEDQKPQGCPEYTPNYAAMPYYDLVRNEWRSFSINHAPMSVCTCHAVWIPEDGQDRRVVEGNELI